MTMLKGVDTKFVFREGGEIRNRFIEYRGKAGNYLPDLGTEEYVRDFFLEHGIRPDDQIMIFGSSYGCNQVIRLPSGPVKEQG